MCWFFKKKRTPVEPAGKAEGHSTADQIRKYAKITFITPARQKGQKSVSFSAIEIHKGLGLTDRYPAVCSAIDARKFCEFAKVKLVRREGKKQTSAVRWTFKV